MTNLDQVRAKVIEAVPEIKEDYLYHASAGRIGETWEKEITLADVLRAIDKSLSRDAEYKIFNIYSNGVMAWEIQDDEGYPSTQESAEWNLSKSLDDQEEPVIAFLYKILCHD